MNDANAEVSKYDRAGERFEALLRLLDADRERAGEKYEDLRRRLIKFFQWNSCVPAEDLVDETLDRVTEKLPESPVLDVVGFAWGVAKHVRQEASKQSERIVQMSDLPGGTELPSKDQGPERVLQEEMEDERRAECLRRCLRRFSNSDREVFLKYHHVQGEHTEYRQRLATNLGLSIGALRVKINRLREKLENCLQQCMRGDASNKRS